jgi:hypothetical protein
VTSLNPVEHNFVATRARSQTQQSYANENFITLVHLPGLPDNHPDNQVIDAQLLLIFRNPNFRRTIFKPPR